jgi:predicted MFS family arabinose efflux permease
MIEEAESRADWGLVAPLGALTLTAYAVWIYGFGVQVDAMAADLNWSTGRLGIAFGGAQLFTGVMALAVGHWLDRRAPGPVLAVVGSIGSMLLLAASAARPTGAFAVLYALGGGLVGAAGFYSATMGVLVRLVKNPNASISALTIVGAFCAPVFLPIVRAATSEFGWRQTLAAMALLNLGAFVMVGMRLADHGAPVASGLPLPAFHRSIGPALQSTSRSARGLLLASLLVGAGLGVALAFQIPAMTTAGITAGAATGFASLRALMQLGGRVPLTPMVARFGPARTLLGAYCLSAVGLAFLAGADRWVVGAAYAVFAGAGFGAMSPLHGMVGRDVFAPESVGVLLGAQSALSSLGSALGPALGGLLIDRTDSHVPGMVLATLCVLGAALTLGRTAGKPDY